MTSTSDSFTGAPPGIQIRFLGPDDLDLLCAVQPGLFDEDIRPDQACAFLDDPANMIWLAYDDDMAVGMVTATVLLHPDKPPSLFVNEVGTRDGWLRRGIARALMQTAIATARARGIKGVWLGTEVDNEPARALYQSLQAQEVMGVYYGWDGAL